MNQEKHAYNTSDIYYKDVALFKTQSVVDKAADQLVQLVDDIAASAGLKRQDFHVVSQL
jgi:DNA topoisomerase VI subunit A